jgi:hypothetical protein
MSDVTVKYATVAEIKAALPNDSWSSAFDAALDQALIWASRDVDEYLGRAPGAFAASATSVKYFNGSGKVKLFVPEMAAAPTEVAVAEGGVIDGAGGTGGTYTVWSTQDYFLEPLSALDDVKPYTQLVIDRLNGSKTSWYKFRKAVKITAAWGYCTTSGSVPQVNKATIIQAMRHYKRGRQGYEDVGAIQSLAQMRYVKAYDREMKALIEHMRRLPI